MTISRRILGVVLGLGLFGLAACNIQNISAPGLAKEKDEAARAVFEAFRKGDLSTLQMGAEMNTPEARAVLPQIVAAVPKEAPTRVRLASWKSNWTALSGPRVENLVTGHEYTYPDRVLMVETVMARDIAADGKPGPWRVRGFHMVPQGGGPAAPGPGPSELAPAAGAEPPADSGAFEPQPTGDEAAPAATDDDLPSGKNVQGNGR